MNNICSLRVSFLRIASCNCSCCCYIYYWEGGQQQQPGQSTGQGGGSPVNWCCLQIQKSQRDAEEMQDIAQKVLKTWRCGLNAANVTMTEFCEEWVMEVVGYIEIPQHLLKERQSIWKRPFSKLFLKLCANMLFFVLSILICVIQATYFCC